MTLKFRAEAQQPDAVKEQADAAGFEVWGVPHLPGPVDGASHNTVTECAVGTEGSTVSLPRQYSASAVVSSQDTPVCPNLNLAGVDKGPSPVQPMAVSLLALSGGPTPASFPQTVLEPHCGSCLVPPLTAVPALGGNYLHRGLLTDSTISTACSVSPKSHR